MALFSLVTGTEAGSTYGVAKGANIIPVKVLNAQGSGTGANVIAGIEWVMNQHGSSGTDKKSVANMSLGGGYFQAENDAVAAAVNAGVVFVVAAGNENQDACNVSPASEPTAITVGSTTSSDNRSNFSNFGTCVDIFAPGSSITSAWIGSDSATRTISGTSMASPRKFVGVLSFVHSRPALLLTYVGFLVNPDVAGAAALLLQANPDMAAPAVADALKSMATTGKVIDAGPSSPNNLLYVSDIASSPAPEPAPAPAPQPSPSPSAAVEIFINFDNYWSETSYTLEKKVNGAWTFVMGLSSASSGTDYSEIASLTDGDYRFTIYDSYGDGLCCGYGYGDYKLKDINANWVFATGGEFAEEEEQLFSVVDGNVVVTPPPTNSPPPPPPSPSVAVDVVVTHDYYYWETTFAIQKQTSSGSWTTIRFQNAPSSRPSSPITVTETLDGGNYRFVIYDSYGDGICCSYGNGSRLVANGSYEFASGGSFSSSDTVYFSVASSTAAVFDP